MLERSICFKVFFNPMTSLIPKPMTMVFGLGTRLHVRMHTGLENGTLRNGQQWCEQLN